MIGIIAPAATANRLNLLDDPRGLVTASVTGWPSKCKIVDNVSTSETASSSVAYSRIIRRQVCGPRWLLPAASP